MTHELVGSTEGQRLCAPKQAVPDMKDVFNLTQGYNVLLEYMENGHITMLMNNPSAKRGEPGLVFVYGTQNGSVPYLFDTVHPKWGSSDSQDGSLLTVSSFDDGKCY